YCRLTSVFLYSDPAPTESYALSLHDALPIFVDDVAGVHDRVDRVLQGADVAHHPADALGAVLTAVQMGVADMGENEHRSSGGRIDRKSTRLNSSHVKISYAVFCLKKKTEKCS